MRLLARSVPRAFPELDAFSDAECRIFVRNATASPWRRAMRFAVGVTVIAVLVAVELRLLLPASNVVPSSALIAWVLVAVLCTIGVGSLVVRDLLLRLAVRRVLGLGAACPQCGYPLTGLPVGADFGVTCPECARVLDVSVHAAHCARGTDGLLRFLPGPGAQLPKDPWLTRRRVRTVATWSAAAVAVLLLLGSIPAALWEWRLRGMASAANDAAASLSPALELLESTAPAGSKVPGANAIDALTEFQALCAPLEGSTLVHEMDGWPQCWWFGASRQPGPGGDRPPLQALAEVAAQLVPVAREAGLLDALGRLGDAPAIRIAAYPVSGNMLMPQLAARSDALGKSVHRASNLAALWLLDACARKQPVEAARAFRAITTLSSVSGMLWPSPHAGQVVGAAQLLEHLGWAFTLPGGDEALRIVKEAIRRNLACRYTPESLVALETRMFQEELVRAFGDPAVLRWRVFPWVRTRAYENAIGFRWGRGAPVADDPPALAFEFDREWDASLDALPRVLLLDAQSAPWLAPDSGAAVTLLPPVASTYLAWTHRWSPGLQFARLADFAVACVPGIEEFRRANGRLPASLAELVPAHLPALPPKSLGIVYRTVDDPACPLGYQLYSDAFDGSDDGCSPLRDYPIVGWPIAPSHGAGDPGDAPDASGASTTPAPGTPPN